MLDPFFSVQPSVLSFVTLKSPQKSGPCSNFCQYLKWLKNPTRNMKKNTADALTPNMRCPRLFCSFPNEQASCKTRCWPKAGVSVVSFVHLAQMGRQHYLDSSDFDMLLTMSVECLYKSSKGLLTR